VSIAFKPSPTTSIMLFCKVVQVGDGPGSYMCSNPDGRPALKVTEYASPSERLDYIEDVSFGRG
jgi:hypothetical protein